MLLQYDHLNSPSFDIKGWDVSSNLSPSTVWNALTFNHTYPETGLVYHSGYQYAYIIFMDRVMSFLTVDNIPRKKGGILGIELDSLPVTVIQKGCINSILIYLRLF